MDELIPTLNIAIESAAFQGTSGRMARTATAREVSRLRSQLERILQDLPDEATVADLRVALEGGYDDEITEDAA